MVAAAATAAGPLAATALQRRQLCRWTRLLHGQHCQLRRRCWTALWLRRERLIPNAATSALAGLAPPARAPKTAICLDGQKPDTKSVLAGCWKRICPCELATDDRRLAYQRWEPRNITIATEATGCSRRSETRCSKAFLWKLNKLEKKHEVNNIP